MTTLRDVELSYAIYKALDDGLYLVRRTTDGEVLLARPLDTAAIPDNDGDDDNNTNNDTVDKLIHHNAARPAAQLLNHENLISIHDELVHHPLRPSPFPPSNNPYDNNPSSTPTSNTPTRMLLWDHPDAGTLADLLADYDPASQSSHAHSDPAAAAGGFLPESLVWHVALSLLRALQWLHEGVRDTYSVVQRGNGNGGGEVWEKVRGKTVAEGDWWPVLHRDLRAGNVFLQHPRGVETYGAVKLGGFGRCFVSSGAVGGERGMPVVAMEREDGVGLGALRERMGRWKRDHLGLAQVSLFALLFWESGGLWMGCDAQC
jgi:hypothetical protein